MQCTLIKNFTTPLTGVSSVHCGQSLGFFNFSAMEEDIEIWGDIPDYEGSYKASNLANVKSLARTIVRCNGRQQSFKERILKPHLNREGYYQVHLCVAGKQKTYTRSTLVAMAFLNHKPDGYKTVVDHKDNIKTNDYLSNLQLITNRKNSSKDQFRHNRSSKYVGVSWDKGANKWVSQIVINSKNTRLGRFSIEEDAAEAYQNKLKEINQK